jgi:hypothetical protein
MCVTSIYHQAQEAGITAKMKKKETWNFCEKNGFDGGKEYKKNVIKLKLKM